MRKHDNSDAYFSIQNETVLQRVDYDNFEDKKPFQNPNLFVGNCSWYNRPIKLDIEVEINESLQRLLNSSCSSNTDLIDVTLIRKTPSFPETTVSLPKPEVKRFLDMVSRNQDERDYTNKPKFRRSKSEDHKRFNDPCSLTTTDIESRPYERLSRGFHDDQTESIYTDYSEKTYDNLSNGYQYNRHEKVYTSPDMFTKLRSSLACQHSRKHGGDSQKPGTPCLCQHCGMIGVLIESQKRPLIPHPTLPETKQYKSRTEYKKERRSRTSEDYNYEFSPRYRHESYTAQTELLPQDTLFEDLLSKLQSLEARVLAQEEKAIGKDYFQNVIRKMLSQYIAKMVQSELPDNVKSSGTQYSRVYLDELELDRPKDHKHRHRHKQRRKSSLRDCSDTNSRESSLDRNLNTNFKIKRKHIINDSSMKYRTETDNSRHPKNRNVRYFDDEPSTCTKKHWKDIRTEKDFKDRILSLIEGETGYKKEKNSVFPPEAVANKEIKVESFQNTLCLPQVIHSGRTLIDTQEKQNENNRTVTTSALKDLLDNMSSQIYEDFIKGKNSRLVPPKAEQPKYHNMQKALDDTLFKRNIEASKKREMQSTKDCRRNDDKQINTSYKSGQAHLEDIKSPRENLDIKYLNPAADIWAESSNAEFIKPKRRETLNKSENIMLAKDSLTYKIEYLKGLARSKNINEDELWRSIWRQTKNRFKSKNDILTISIPSRKRTKKPIELELTWSDLKEIMRSTRSKASHEVSSCDLLHNQKKNREYNLYQNEYTKKNHTYKQRSKSVK